MERLYSSQKTYVYLKSFTLKLFLTISLFFALFQISELNAQNLIISNTGSVSSSSGKLISCIIPFVITELVATTDLEISDSILNLSEILPLTTSFLLLDEGMGERSIVGYVLVNLFK